MPCRVENVNPEILRKCREQIALRIADVESRINKIDLIENGEMFPTFNQLNTLAELYNVPQWVFLRAKLPRQYNYREMPLFRQYTGRESTLNGNYKARLIASRVEQFREVVLELSIDIDNQIPIFTPPDINANDVSDAAEKVRSWLQLGNKACGFDNLKKAVASKNVFIFMTSKFPDWSKVEHDEFRGFAIYRERLPIIVINSSDAVSAHSFTLMHELGHLIFNKKSVFSEFSESPQSKEEKQCNLFAGEILMPQNRFMEVVRNFVFADGDDSLRQIDSYARNFKVSSLACAVRMLHLRIISHSDYKKIRASLLARVEKERKRGKKGKEGISRNIAREKFNQYGHICCQTIIQAYHEKEISLHKSYTQFGLKNARDFYKLEKML